MSKTGRTFNGLISVNVSEDMRHKLVALAWLKLGNKAYAPLVREYIFRAAEADIAALTPGERIDFVRILESVSITAKVRRQGLQDPEPGPE